jgi:hypothetical protein
LVLRVKACLARNLSYDKIDLKVGCLAHLHLNADEL